MDVISGGCTRFLQPADLSWNKCFKSKLSELYDTWIDGGEHDFTRSGAMCAPSLERVCQWITDVWSMITTDMVKKSFASCGITTAIDGSEDDAIVCLRSEEMKDACQKLVDEMAALQRGESV